MANIFNCLFLVIVTNYNIFTLTIITINLYVTIYNAFTTCVFTKNRLTMRIKISPTFTASRCGSVWFSVCVVLRVFFGRVLLIFRYFTL